MRIIPVLDLKGGQVVRGVGGRRMEYRPIVSSLVAGSDPRVVATVLVERFQPREIYLADLDAIAGGLPLVELYTDLNRLGVEVWVDAGIRTRRDAEALTQVGVSGIVCGLESLEGPEVLGEIVNDLGPERVLFSLDLHAGRLLGDLRKWRVDDRSDVCGVVARAVEMGIRRMIVLDLTQVGKNDGTGTEELCRQIAETYPQGELFVGGGVRGREDLQRLSQSGVAGVLVASALHDGRIEPHRS